MRDNTLSLLSAVRPSIIPSPSKSSSYRVKIKGRGRVFPLPPPPLFRIWPWNRVHRVRRKEKKDPTFDIKLSPLPPSPFFRLLVERFSATTLSLSGERSSNAVTAKRNGGTVDCASLRAKREKRDGRKRMRVGTRERERERERAGPLRRPNPCGLLYRLPIGWARFRPDVGRP